MGFKITKKNLNDIEKLYESYSNFHNLGIDGQKKWLDILKQEIERIKNNKE